MNYSDKFEVYQLLDVLNITVDQLWNESDGFYQFTQRDFVKGIDYFDEFIILDEEMHLTTVYSVEGRCTVLYSNSSFINYQSTPNVRLTLVRNGNDSAHELIVKVRISPFEEIGDPLFYKQGDFLLAFGSVAVVNFDTFMYERLNRSQQICDTSDSVRQCERNCLLDKFKEDPNITCSLPFMWPDVGVSACNSSEFKRTYAASLRIFEDYNPSQCGCPIKCNEVKFKQKFMYYRKWPFLNMTMNAITYDYTIITYTEYWPFSFSGLVSEIGGNLGLFLGVCVINLAELIEYVFLATVGLYIGKKI